METLEFRAMNTSVLLAAEGRDWALIGMQDARAFIEESERRFSRFLPESELSQLNASVGQWFAASDELLDVLMQSLKYYDETGGLFDPSILPDLKRAGYDKSMDDLRAQGAAVEDSPRSDQRSRPAFNEINLDLAGKRVRLPRDMEIDLGGSAKGWIVQKAAMLLSSYAAVCAVSAGGDIFFIGNPLDAPRWRGEIEDPLDADRTAAVLSGGPRAVVPSSVTKRAWKQDGLQRHHLIDPRSGTPARTDWLSATVIAPSITMAEVYAKALLIGGSQEMERLTTRRPEMAFIAVDAEGQLIGSQNSREYLNDYDYVYQQ